MLPTIRRQCPKDTPRGGFGAARKEKAGDQLVARLVGASTRLAATSALGPTRLLLCLHDRNGRNRRRTAYEPFGLSPLARAPPRGVRHTCQRNDTYQLRISNGISPSRTHACRALDRCADHSSLAGLRGACACPRLAARLSDASCISHAVRPSALMLRWLRYRLRRDNQATSGRRALELSSLFIGNTSPVSRLPVKCGSFS